MSEHEVEEWSWNFTYLCPNCGHRFVDRPTHLSYEVTLSKEPNRVVAKFVCGSCESRLAIHLATLAA